jgi:hypothetical protein
MYKSKAILSTATGEDINTFLNYATKYLEFQKSYGTGSSYQSIYDAVLADVTGLGEVKNEQLEIAKQQLAALNIIAMNTSDNPTRQIGSVYADGGLTSGPSIAGEAGPEWIVPTYEPQKSKFLKSVGLDPNTLGAAIASKIGNTGGEVTVHTHVYLDGVEIQDCVAKGMTTNQNLIGATRRIRN